MLKTELIRSEILGILVSTMNHPPKEN